MIHKRSTALVDDLYIVCDWAVIWETQTNLKTTLQIWHILHSLSQLHSLFHNIPTSIPTSYTKTYMQWGAFVWVGNSLKLSPLWKSILIYFCTGWIEHDHSWKFMTSKILAHTIHSFKCVEIKPQLPNNRCVPLIGGWILLVWQWFLHVGRLHPMTSDKPNLIYFPRFAYKRKPYIIFHIFCLYSPFCMFVFHLFLLLISGKMYGLKWTAQISL